MANSCREDNTVNKIINLHKGSNKIQGFFVMINQAVTANTF